jgi:hypothetical protein
MYLKNVPCDDEFRGEANRGCEGASSVRSKVQTITPAKAAEWLEANTTNRPVSRTVVRSFAEAMKRGEWIVTHQGIAFDVSGVLIDGQHRLAAVLDADVPVAMTVFTDVDDGAADPGQPTTTFG